MRAVFADTYYWIAYLSDQDQGHAAARAISQTLQGATLVITEEVFIELPTYFSGRGRYLRQLAAATVRSVYAHSKMHVLPQSRQIFLNGLCSLRSPAGQGIQPHGLHFHERDACRRHYRSADRR
jgi:uncharacterized protein